MGVVHTPRIKIFGKYRYDFNKAMVCECSQVKEVREVINKNRVMYFDPQLMYFNIDKNEYECFWCGKIKKLDTFNENFSP